MSELRAIITASDPVVRNRSLHAFCERAGAEQLLAEVADLESLRHDSENLYERVRALFFLYAIYRFYLSATGRVRSGTTLIPFRGYEKLLSRRYEEAIGLFLAAQHADGPSDGLSSALAAAYRGLAFQTLADQVRRSVRSVRGNQWMFRTGHAADYTLRLRRELLHRADGGFPILHESTPVRMDLSHSGWSDIFFLGMDLPELARVLNVSIDLSLHGSNTGDPKPPIETFLRVIDRPVIRLVSIDLDTSAEIHELEEIFDFGRDYLGLLKAAVIGSGLIPPGLESSGQPLAGILHKLLGEPGLGLEIISQVNNIPKGSRLAVSTNLLASLIAVLMRATGQTTSLTGQLLEPERRLVAARAILGEWLGGSGGGWQDSGGVWPGIKVIEGVCASEGDAEFGVSRGRLLPDHRILAHSDVSDDTRRLQDSLVLVHGGMSQDVGPILEMVTERYLLRSDAEWKARLDARTIFDEILGALRGGDVHAVGSATQRNFDGPIKTIIPWATNLYTETVIHEVRSEFGDRFWGFWMLGGMSGGGMGFIFDPAVKARAQARLGDLMRGISHSLAGGVAFAMDPVVYDFAINERGTFAELRRGSSAVLPDGYYNLMLPALLRKDQRLLTAGERSDLERFSSSCIGGSGAPQRTRQFLDRLLPHATNGEVRTETLDSLLANHGFDAVQHERIQLELRAGQIGLAKNRIPPSVRIEDVHPRDVFDARKETDSRYKQIGEEALASGTVAVVTLAGGAGSRWTHGAGVVKALSPFCQLAGKHRTFLEVHLAKSRRAGRLFGSEVPHIITTSYLTHQPTAQLLERTGNYGYTGPLLLSPGRNVGLRLIPMERDLRFAWEETPQQMLDEQAQKVRESSRAALIAWAKQAGEGSNYTDNLPLQCLHPVGHWYEIPNLFRNGVLEHLLQARPHLRYLMVHNVDTMGANLEPEVLGRHIDLGATMTVEVITRRIEDRGGGLARADGRLRLIEGMALPSEDVEFNLSFYNSNTFWIDIDALLAVFGLSRSELSDQERVAAAVRAVASRMPTYITLKDVKKRWGKGQEDIYPVTQFEKLWVDMTALPEMSVQYAVVPRMRGQQLKEPAQLDGWLRDGSAAYVSARCDFA